MQIRLPEQAGGNGPPRPPLFSQLTQLDFAEPVASEAFADRDLQSEIVGRPDVRAAERKDEVDLGAPAADSLKGNQFRERILVGDRLKPGEIQPPVADGSGE